MEENNLTTLQGAAVTHKDEESGITYLSGYGNTFESETVQGALPLGRNSPRKVPFDLYAEQLSGTAFTQPRYLNQRTWLYRKQPSASMNTCPFECTETFFGGCDPDKGILDPNALRWMPFTKNEGEDPEDFVSGTHLLGASGDPAQKSGIAIYVFLCQKSMTTADGNSYMYNADGDLLILPQEGGLEICTEVGKLMVKPGEFCVIPRGMVFSVNLVKDGDTDGNFTWRGYVLEVYKGHLVLPELGPIGSNGLANARDFLYPTAWTEENTTSKVRTIYNKFGSKLWKRPLDLSPFNVLAWHGNYLPYKYDLAKFCAINSVTYDHIDPSIYTVMTCMGDEVGTALCDFVIFPPRWISTDPNTFRPPWFHRNCMTEFMGLIWGGYDAKKSFLPGGASLHSCMTPHGPDAVSYSKAVADPCDKPTYFSNGLAFMFETTSMLQLSEWALKHKCVDTEYGSCWSGLPNQFDESKK